jgi:hypothetical protein
MKAPARDPVDFCIAQGAESTLFMPEIAKSAGTPKRGSQLSVMRYVTHVKKSNRNSQPTRRTFGWCRGPGMDRTSAGRFEWLAAA